MDTIKQNNYLGNEKISKLLLKFSVPCVISLLITALYNIVDQIFVGNSELGYLGNAATGIVFPLLIITQAFAWWFGDGCAAHLSICQGRKNVEKSNCSIATGMILTILVSIILMAIALTLKEPILKLFGASNQTLEMSSQYLSILCLFFPIYMLQNMMSPVIRSDGSPIYSMICLGAGAIINIILDPIFIYLFNWGIAGAAWATVIGQIVSFIITAVYFFNTKTFKLKWKSFVPNFKIFKEAAVLGISSFITQISIVIISLVCNIMLYKYGAMSKYGPDIPISIISIETKVFTVLINIIVGIVLGGQPIFGYNIGAGKMDRVKKTYKYILILTIVISLIFTIINEIYPDIFILPFGDGGIMKELYMEYGRKTFRIFLSFVTCTCLIKMSSIFFQSVGKPIFAMISSLTRDIICFIPVVIILPILFETRKTGSGIIGLLYAAPIADIIAFSITFVMTIIYFRTVTKSTILDQEDRNELLENVVIKASKPGVIITIAREHGSLGKQIGKVLAEKLNIPFYSKEVIALAADECGLSEEYILKDKIKQAITYDLFLSKDSNIEAVEAQRRILHRIAKQGSCIIVGRAADYILKNDYNVFSIFIYAEEDVKIANVMKIYNDDKNEAIKHIKESNESRAKYYEYITQNKWTDVHNYSLCINSSEGIEAVVERLIKILN